MTGVGAPEVSVWAPGRVNLIGGHVDFHGGLVVCAALDSGIRVQATTADRAAVDRVVVRSEGWDGVVRLAPGDLDDPAAVDPPWGRLVAAVLRELRDRGIRWAPFEATVRTTLPAGAGLSSSAAFGVATTMAAAAAAGVELAPMDVAHVARAAEVAATSVACGIQDQAASVLGGVVLLDCRTLVPSPLTLPPDAGIAVVDSKVPRRLEGSPWAARRAESFADADAIGVAELRDATLEQVRDRPRARHVVEEIERVERFAEALGRRDLEAAGRLMVASHGSSRDLWESSTPELDVIVEELLAAGAYGARLTGGGFGGCVVALVPVVDAAGIAARAATAASERLGRRVEPLPVGLGGAAVTSS